MNPEIVGAFKKSSYSGQNGNCVEVASTVDGGCVVRDSKDPAGPRLVLGEGAWASFVGVLKAGGSAS
ncbi:DUF397 domain-containing protein [Streptomyces celluloflavus]|uniref:DUF397 domain-containing protein n=1 Tax=Streptomyces celluloflavus TaxID=58344 RepID=UPI0036772776